MWKGERSNALGSTRSERCWIYAPNNKMISTKMMRVTIPKCESGDLDFVDCMCLKTKFSAQR